MKIEIELPDNIFKTKPALRQIYEELLTIIEHKEIDTNSFFGTIHSAEINEKHFTKNGGTKIGNYYYTLKKTKHAGKYIIEVW